MYNSHYMKDCIVVEQVTLGIIRPATFGGMNGDISRKYFLGVNEMARLITNLANYKRFAFIHIKLRSGYNRRISYHDKKYYNKHRRYINLLWEIDYHKNDEYLKKLKFNLNVFISSLPKRYRPSMISQKERSNLYYKDLMKNFAAQVIAK